MYQDAGYGNNWQPRTNNARRIDPYTRSCAILGTLFAIGFFLVIIVVLSLIPLYISRNSSATITTTNNNNSQVTKISINNYVLQFQSPFNNFNPQTILSETNNRQALEAAFTSMIQTDLTMAGSVIEINSTSIRTNRKRRQISTLISFMFNLNIITNQSCSSPTCINQLQSHTISLLSNTNQVTLIFRYQESNSSQIYWLYCQLPQTIQPNVSFVYVDLKILSTLLNTLILIDKTENQPLSIENSTSILVG